MRERSEMTPGRLLFTTSELLDRAAAVPGTAEGCDLATGALEVARERPLDGDAAELRQRGVAQDLTVP
jgi:hypothetical protein